MLDKRYQVFVSSTYTDLEEERREVMQALLELNCIPAGMEMFPAADEDQWSLIKKVIDDCDYYLVIVGGRYGSLSPTGISFTQMEYEYAITKGKPIIGFIHKDPGSISAAKSEKSEEGLTKLRNFRDLVQTRMVKYWTAPADLGSVVSRSLVQLIKAKPGVGWIKANAGPDIETTQEIIKLRKKIDELESELSLVKTAPPKGTDMFTQGEDVFKLKYSCGVVISTGGNNTAIKPENGECNLSWNQIFKKIAPVMLRGIGESLIEHYLNSLIGDVIGNRYAKKYGDNYRFTRDFSLNDNDFQTIKIQLRALGLIEKTDHSLEESRELYWQITPYGDHVMVQLIAKRK